MKEGTTNQASADSVMSDLRTTLVFQPNAPRFWKALVGVVSLVVRCGLAWVVLQL